jgi:hypothetical protein
MSSDSRSFRETTFGERTSHFNNQFYLSVYPFIRTFGVTAIRLLYLLLLCRAASDFHQKGRVSCPCTVLASVVEFRSTISEIDKILTRLPTLHHMAFGLEMAQAQTALVPLLKEWTWWR